MHLEKGKDRESEAHGNVWIHINSILSILDLWSFELLYTIPSEL